MVAAQLSAQLSAQPAQPAQAKTAVLQKTEREKPPVLALASNPKHHLCRPRIYNAFLPFFRALLKSQILAQKGHY